MPPPLPLRSSGAAPPAELPLLAAPPLLPLLGLLLPLLRMESLLVARPPICSRSRRFCAADTCGGRGRGGAPGTLARWGQQLQCRAAPQLQLPTAGRAAAAAARRHTLGDPGCCSACACCLPKAEPGSALAPPAAASTAVPISSSAPPSTSPSWNRLLVYILTSAAAAGRAGARVGGGSAKVQQRAWGVWGRVCQRSSSGGAGAWGAGGLAPGASPGHPEGSPRGLRLTGGRRRAPRLGGRPRPAEGRHLSRSGCRGLFSPEGAVHRLRPRSWLIWNGGVVPCPAARRGGAGVLEPRAEHARRSGGEPAARPAGNY
jgi:hypothetical protein